MTDSEPTMSQSNDSASESQSAPNASSDSSPGTITMTDNTTPDDEKPIDHYECPFCDYADPSERVVRTHITREDDSRHRNRNAFLDTLKIQAVAEDGTKIDVDAPGTTRYEGESTTELLPAGVTEGTRKAEILREAVRNPESSLADIGEVIYGDRDSLSYPHALVGDYFGTVEDEDPLTYPEDVDLDELPDDVRETFAARSDTQQITFLTAVYSPDTPAQKIAQRLGVHKTTPRKALKRYEDHVEDLKTHLTTHDSPAGTHPDGDEDEDDGKAETAEPSEPVEAEPTAAEAKPELAQEIEDDALRVPRGDLQKFEAKLSGIRDTAEFSDDKSMLYVVQHVEEFLAEIAEENDR